MSLITRIAVALLALFITSISAPHHDQALESTMMQSMKETAMVVITGDQPGSVHFDPAPYQDLTQNERIDYGEVLIGQQLSNGISLNCTNSNYCKLINVDYPSPPFFAESVSNLLDVEIPAGGSISIELLFQPFDTIERRQVFSVRWCGYTQIAGAPALESCLQMNVVLIGRGISVGTDTQAPTARCTYSPTNPLVGVPINFSSENSSDPDGTIERFDWNFGDGSLSQEPNPVHTYQSIGTYQVSLTVTDNDNLNGSTQCSVRVSQTERPESSNDSKRLAISAGVGLGVAIASYALLHQPSFNPKPRPKSGFTTLIDETSISAAVAGTTLVLFPQDQLILRFASDISAQRANNIINQFNGTIIGEYPYINSYLVRFDSVNSAIDKISALNAIEAQIESSQGSAVSVIKNYFGKLEGQFCDLCNLDPSLARSYNTIKVIQAWQYLKDTNASALHDVRIGIIDTGIDGRHEDFSALNIDGKSYLASDKSRSKAWLNVTNNHGTWVSGIIGAVNNGINNMNGMIAGFTDDYEMIVFKTDVSAKLDPDVMELDDETNQRVGSMLEIVQMPISSVLDAIAEAATAPNGVDIINLSLGWDRATLEAYGAGTDMDIICDLMTGTIENFSDILFVASAGNGDQPNDISRSSGIHLYPSYCLHVPGGIELDNLITVGATNATGTSFAPFSNYGRAVSLAAPGENIYSTSTGNGRSFERSDGTSVATPLVTGAAALLRSIDPVLKPADIKRMLIETSDERANGLRVLNMLEAVKHCYQQKQARDGKRPLIALIAALALGGGYYIALSN